MVQSTPSGPTDPIEIARESMSSAVAALSAAQGNPGGFVQAMVAAAVHMEKHMDQCRQKQVEVDSEVLKVRQQLQAAIENLLGSRTLLLNQFQNLQLGQLNSALVKLRCGRATQAINDELKERANKLAATQSAGFRKQISQPNREPN